jgi:signal transduction histidine kinase
MHRLLDNLTTWSAIEGRRLKLQERSVPIREWLDVAIGVTAPLLERRGQRVSVNLPTAEPHVFGDPICLAQVVTNLLSNASRYSSDGDVISVSVTLDDAMMTVRVADHGPGIPFAEQPLLFERHFRGARAVATGSTGQGLGLAIVRQLVEMHGGSVGVESTPGEGAAFWFTLRCDPASSSRVSVMSEVAL